MRYRYWILGLIATAVAAAATVVVMTRAQRQETLEAHATTANNHVDFDVRYLVSNGGLEKSLSFDLDWRSSDEELLAQLKQALHEVPYVIPQDPEAVEELLAVMDFYLPPRTIQPIEGPNGTQAPRVMAARLKISTIEVIRTRSDQGIRHRLQFTRSRTNLGKIESRVDARTLVPDTADIAAFHDLMCRNLVKEIRRAQVLHRDFGG